MTGMSRISGTELGGEAHLRQSIEDILGTPIGTRVMLREYGSRLFELIDRPAGPGATVEIYAAVAEALDRWEPRIRLTRVQTSDLRAGQIEIDLAYNYLPAGQAQKLEGIIIA